MSAIQDVADRYARYCSLQISQIISPHDDMFVAEIPEAMQRYMSVGRSAVDIILGALVAAGNPPIRRILDLPCGAGRVTRHLCALFPDCEIFVSDVEPQKEDFVVTTLKTMRAESNQNFVDDPARQYDLIFVGSLVTHLNAAKFRRAVKWFIRALAPNGLLIVTTHGRTNNYLIARKWRRGLKFLRIRLGYKIAGFGYAPFRGVPSYGTSASSPSWVLRLIEKEPFTKIIGFHEAAWADHQDVLVVQKYDLTKIML